MANSSGTHVIELRLCDSAQLFNTLDPFPFRESDLSAEAEEYIVTWAQDLPRDSPISILVHVQSDGAGKNQNADLQQAITNWFTARAAGESRAIRSQFRDGRIALLTGFVVLGLCLILSWAMTQNYDNTFARVLGESLIIIGWVVMWRPAEIFLYDWMPMARRMRLFNRLANAHVTVQRA